VRPWWRKALEGRRRDGEDALLGELADCFHGFTRPSLAGSS
jgi:hypothetical protein